MSESPAAMNSKSFNPFKVREYSAEDFAQFAANAREVSRQRAQDKEDSFQRCDTDGFLSQWASGLSSDLAHRQAELLDNCCRTTFEGLYQGDRRVKAKLVRVKNPFSHQTDWLWKLDESETALIAARGKKWLPSSEKSRILKQLGLTQRTETDFAWAKLDGSGTGLSGTCYVSVFRIGDEWGGEAVVVSEEVAK